MAVTIKKKALTLTSLVKRLFSLEAGQADLMNLAKALEHGGYKLTTEPTVLKIENEHAVLSEANVKLSAVQKALKGNLTYAGKKMLQGHIEQFIKKGYNLMPDATEKQDLAKIYDLTMAEYHPNGNKVAAIKKYRMLTGSSLKDAKDKVEAWIAAEKEAAGPLPTDEEANEAYHKAVKENKAAPNTVGVTITGLDPDKYTTVDVDPDPDIGTPVELSEAEQLHQPIKGTSGGSIYHVIALSPDAKVAARIKNTDVAIRVHPLNNAGKAACKVAGLDEKSGGHWSIHLHPDSKLLVKKCVGAVLFAMGLKDVSISPDLSAIDGAGK